MLIIQIAPGIFFFLQPGISHKFLTLLTLFFFRIKEAIKETTVGEVVVRMDVSRT